MILEINRNIEDVRMKMDNACTVEEYEYYRELLSELCVEKREFLEKEFHQV